MAQAVDWQAELNKPVPKGAAPGADVDWQKELDNAPGPGYEIAEAKPAVPQYQGWLRQPRRLLGEVASGALDLLALPGTIQQYQRDAMVASGTDKWLPSWATKDLSGGLWPKDQPLWLTREQLSAPTNWLGLTNNPALAPQGPVERYSGAAARAALPTAASIATGQVELLPGLGSGLGSSLAAQGASDLTEGNPLAVLGAGLFGGLGGQGLATSFQGDRLERIASTLGKSSTWQDAGEELQAAARAWSKDLPKRLANLAAPLEKLVPKDAPVSLDPILGALKQITARGGKLSGAVQEMSGKMPGKLKNIFQGHKDLADLSGGDNAAAWRDVREFRTYLGNALANPKLAGDLDEESLKQLYAVTTKTLGDTAAAHGATDLWKIFNTESTRLHQIQRGPMSRLISTDNAGREMIKPEDAARSVFSSGKKGGTDLEQLRAELPGATNEVAAAALRQGVWDKFSPEAKAALISDPKVQKQLAHLQVSPPSLTETVSHYGSSGAGFLGGGTLGKLAAKGLDLDPATGEAVGEALGLALPWAARAGRHALTNPDARGAIPLSSAAALSVNGLMPIGKLKEK